MILIIQADYICEFCFKPGEGDIPNSWDFVWQSAVCPDCKAKVATHGGYAVVKGGTFAFCSDPRRSALSHEKEEG